MNVAANAWPRAGFVTAVAGFVLAAAILPGSPWTSVPSAQYGGKICFGDDNTIVPCPPKNPPPPPPPPKKKSDGDQERGTLMEAIESVWEEGFDAFCNTCHVNRTSEVSGPRTLRATVMNDPPLFWRRHDVIAARMANKRVLTPVRDERSLSPELRRLMEARPRR